MFKKLMLSTVLVLSSFVQAENDTNHTLAIVAATTVCVGTGAYLAMRESNAVKIARAEKWLKYYSGNLHYDLAEIATLQDMQNFVNKSTKFKKEMLVFADAVEFSYAEMHARYASWIKPWNWNEQMKVTYARIQELRNIMRMIKMMFKYQPLMKEWNYELDEATIIKSVQTICQGCSSYPLCFCADMMQHDLYFLHKTHFKVACDVALIDMLEKLLEFVLGSAAYVEEKRIQEEMELKQRQAQAQQMQAMAQFAQADAQNEQARAQRERNEIEKKKLEEKKKKKD